MLPLPVSRPSTSDGSVSRVNLDGAGIALGSGNMIRIAGSGSVRGSRSSVDRSRGSLSSIARKSEGIPESAERLNVAQEPKVNASERLEIAGEAEMDLDLAEAAQATGLEVNLVASAGNLVAAPIPEPATEPFADLSDQKSAASLARLVPGESATAVPSTEPVAASSSHLAPKRSQDEQNLEPSQTGNQKMGISEGFGKPEQPDDVFFNLHAGLAPQPNEPTNQSPEIPTSELEEEEVELSQEELESLVQEALSRYGLDEDDPQLEDSNPDADLVKAIGVPLPESVEGSQNSMFISEPKFGTLESVKGSMEPLAARPSSASKSPASESEQTPVPDQSVPVEATTSMHESKAEMLRPISPIRAQENPVFEVEGTGILLRPRELETEKSVVPYAPLVFPASSVDSINPQGKNGGTVRFVAGGPGGISVEAPDPSADPTGDAEGSIESLHLSTFERIAQFHSHDSVSRDQAESESTEQIASVRSSIRSLEGMEPRYEPNPMANERHNAGETGWNEENSFVPHELSPLPEVSPVSPIASQQPARQPDSALANEFIQQQQPLIESLGQNTVDPLSAFLESEEFESEPMLKFEVPRISLNDLDSESDDELQLEFTPDDFHPRPATDPERSRGELAMVVPDPRLDQFPMDPDAQIDADPSDSEISEPDPVRFRLLQRRAQVERAKLASRSGVPDPMDRFHEEFEDPRSQEPKLRAQTPKSVAFYVSFDEEPVFEAPVESRRRGESRGGSRNYREESESAEERKQSRERARRARVEERVDEESEEELLQEREDRRKPTSGEILRKQSKQLPPQPKPKPKPKQRQAPPPQLPRPIPIPADTELPSVLSLVTALALPTSTLPPPPVLHTSDPSSGTPGLRAKEERERIRRLRKSCEGRKRELQKLARDCDALVSRKIECEASLARTQATLLSLIPKISVHHPTHLSGELKGVDLIAAFAPPSLPATGILKTLVGQYNTSKHLHDELLFETLPELERAIEGARETLALMHSEDAEWARAESWIADREREMEEAELRMKERERRKSVAYVLQRRAAEVKAEREREREEKRQRSAWRESKRPSEEAEEARRRALERVRAKNYEVSHSESRDASIHH